MEVCVLCAVQSATIKKKSILACWWPVKAEARCSNKLHVHLVVSTIIYIIMN